MAGVGVKQTPGNFGEVSSAGSVTAAPPYPDGRSPAVLPKGAAMPWILAAVLLACQDRADVDAAELKKLAGAWAVQSHEHGGNKTPAKELAPLTVSFAAGKVTTREKDDVKEESEVVLLDPKAKLAEIDVKITSGTDKGKLVKGIYKLDDDKLTLCFAEPGKDRPKEFAGKQGTGHTLMVLLRQKK